MAHLLMTYDKGSVTDENYDMHWPDCLTVHMSPSEAWRIAQTILAQLQYNEDKDAVINFALVGQFETLEDDKE